MLLLASLGGCLLLRAGAAAQLHIRYGCRGWGDAAHGCWAGRRLGGVLRLRRLGSRRAVPLLRDGLQLTGLPASGSKPARLPAVHAVVSWLDRRSRRRLCLAGRVKDGQR